MYVYLYLVIGFFYLDSVLFLSVNCFGWMDDDDNGKVMIY